MLAVMTALAVIATLAMVVMVSLLGATVAAMDQPAPRCAHPRGDSPIARTDHRASGNRVVSACGPLEPASVVDIELGFEPAWVMPDPRAPGRSWLVASAAGAVIGVSVEPGAEAILGPEPLVRLEPGEPPIARLTTSGELEVSSVHGASSWFDDPLPDARVVEAPGGELIALTAPTDRYPHGVLGDGIEAAAIDVRAPDGDVTRIEVGDTMVIEGIAPIIEDLDADGLPEVIVTVSDMYEGARLVVYDLAGDRRAASAPIGRGFRWMHQIGAGRIGPGGETELIAVRTPHIGGIVEAYRLSDGQLRLVASQPGYSSHRLGSSNLDMALLADSDDDGRLEVIVPVQDMRSLGILSRRGDGFELLDSLPLEATLATNIAASADAGGRLQLAVGTEDGRLRIFG